MNSNSLKVYLKEKNLTLKQLAHTCQISESYMSKIINGYPKGINNAILASMAEGLGVSIDKLNQLLKDSGKRVVTRPAAEREKNAFYEYLTAMLDCLDVSNHAKVAEYNSKIDKLKRQDIDLYPNYIQWYEGWHFALQNHFDEAIDCFSKAESFTAHNDIELRFKAKILGGLGGALTAKGEYQEAMKTLRRSLLTWNDSGKQAGWVYLNMGTLHKRRNDLSRAMETYMKALNMGAPHIKALALSALIQLAVDRKEERQARELIVYVYHRMKKIDNPKGKDNLFCNIGEFYLRMGKYITAELYLNKSVLYSIQSGDLRLKHYAMFNLAKIHMQNENYNAFKNIANELKTEITNSADCVLFCEKLNLMGWEYIKNGQLDKAKVILLESYKIAVKAKAFSEIIYACQGLTKCYKVGREPDNATFYHGEELKAKKSGHF